MLKVEFPLMIRQVLAAVDIDKTPNNLEKAILDCIL